MTLEDQTDLQEQVRAVLDDNRYMVLGTADAEGRPRVTPVYFTHHDYRALYWVSEPTSQHSSNVSSRPEVEAVVFDSTREPKRAEAVYLTGRAHEVDPAVLEEECRRAFAAVGKGARPFAPDELSGTERLRLYRLDVEDHGVHIRGSDPVRGRGIDHRGAVTMPGRSSIA